MTLGLCRRPGDLNWKHIAGAGMLGGIGFTMSIFIATLAFADNTHLAAAKLAVLLASAAAAVLGLSVGAVLFRRKAPAD